MDSTIENLFINALVVTVFIMILGFCEILTNATNFIK
jgi:hypothetical protein